MELDGSEDDNESYELEDEKQYEDSLSLGEMLAQGKVDQNEDALSLGEMIVQEKVDQVEAIIKEKTKNLQKMKWGLIQRMERPRRVPEDGRTMMHKAQDLKKAKNTIQGKFQKTSFALKAINNYQIKLVVLVYLLVTILRLLKVRRFP